MSNRGNECIPVEQISVWTWWFEVNKEDLRVTSIEFVLVFIVLIWKIYFPHAFQERIHGLDAGKHAAQKFFSCAESDKVSVKKCHGENQIRSEENERT